MHSTTIRRLIVVGVCAIGLTVLYVAPSVVSGPIPGGTDGGSSRSVADSAPQAVAQTGGQPQQLPPTSPPLTGATAYEPGWAPDHHAPTPVTDLRALLVTAEELVVTWTPATDNIGVTGYQVLMDGFEVAATTANQASLRWFNNDAGLHVVQVRALDAAGNQSPSSPTLLVTRPPREPLSSPAPGESTGPTPTADGDNSAPTPVEALTPPASHQTS